MKWFFKILHVWIVRHSSYDVICAEGVIVRVAGFQGSATSMFFGWLEVYFQRPSIWSLIEGQDNMHSIFQDFDEVYFTIAWSEHFTSLLL